MLRVVGCVVLRAGVPACVFEFIIFYISEFAYANRSPIVSKRAFVEFPEVLSCELESHKI